jgi:hypothetical protein
MSTIKKENVLYYQRELLIVHTKHSSDGNVYPVADAGQYIGRQVLLAAGASDFADVRGFHLPQLARDELLQKQLNGSVVSTGKRTHHTPCQRGDVDVVP